MDVLPELGDGAGEVGGVAQGVVGEAAVGVPGVSTALPWQVLHQHKDSGVIINVASPKASGEKRNLASFKLKPHFSCKEDGWLLWMGGDLASKSMKQLSRIMISCDTDFPGNNITM